MLVIECQTVANQKKIINFYAISPETASFYKTTMRQTIIFFLILAMVTESNGQNFKCIPHTSNSFRPWNKRPKLNADIFDTTSLRKLNEKNYVAKLKMDNMPCIIPMESKPEIPNKYYNEKVILGKIPNAWFKRDSLTKEK